MLKTHMTYQDLAARGMTTGQIRRAIARGELIKLARGVYIDPDTDALTRIQAVGKTSSGVIALESAALVHGLRLYRDCDEVHLMRPLDDRSRKLNGKNILVSRLPAHHFHEVDGFSFTTAARTVVDLARFRTQREAIVPWESLLWNARESHILEPTHAEIDDVIASLSGCTGIGKARAMRRFADAFSESPPESLSRLIIHDLGLPTPVQQFEVFDEFGHSLGFTDFGWPDLKVLGEYDGQDKYDALARPGERPAQVLMREKRRQQRMEEMGWEFARWDAEALRNPQLVRRAFDRAVALARRRR